MARKFLIVIFLTAILFCLFSSRQEHDGQNLVYGGSMKNAYERSFNASQFDSICKVDKLPRDLNRWPQSSFKDAETDYGFDEYYFIVNNDSCQIIYRVYMEGKNFNVNKRITKK